MAFDIITFGSATRDIMVKPRGLTALKYGSDPATGKGVCFPFGSKIDVEEIEFNSGGGGTNTAATFTKQGFKTAFLGAVGEDSAGKEIKEELKSLNIDTKFVFTIKEKPTNHSIIILTEGEDRTILAYRGAAELLGKENIPWGKLKAKWIYLAPLTGLLCDIFEDIIDFAIKNKIRITTNPSIQQLSMPSEKLRSIFSKIDVLFLNKEEASFLTKIPLQEENEIFKKIDEICRGVVVMTKGGQGVVVSDGEYIYRAKPNTDRKIVDTTGAGDSFASGFISEYIRENGNIEKSIQLGLANSTGCISKVGAKNGLLLKGEQFERVEVQKEMCSENGFCLTK